MTSLCRRASSRNRAVAATTAAAALAFALCPGVASADETPGPWLHVGDSYVVDITGEIDRLHTAKIPYRCPTGALKHVDRTDTTWVIRGSIHGNLVGADRGEIRLTNLDPLAAHRFHLVLECGRDDAVAP